MTLHISLYSAEAFAPVRAAAHTSNDALALFADMCRYNALSEVKLAGSGHLGSSFSALDLLTWLYVREMNTLRVGLDDPARDVFFSSKGHDVPGQYALLHALGILPESQLRKLRRLGGLDGHPDVSIPGIEANTGALGMGISKGRGMAWAKRLRGHGGHVFVMTGDGELQEGQNYEALQTCLQQGVAGLTVVVDHNKLQTDRFVRDITDLGDLEAKVAAFGWHVARVDGHDFDAIERCFTALRGVTDRPKFVIADTVKARGVPFMEDLTALEAGTAVYRWHSGAPDDATFLAAAAALRESIDRRAASLGLLLAAPHDVTPPAAAASGVTREFVAEAYGEALVALGAEHPELVVLDADLSADCRIRGFEQRYPERFIENGIAEQDMVSMAGGLARMGLLPVVNSFASFLAARANEQIYNNACERTRIVYACHFAGMIPAGPGKSHQSVRDLALLGTLPNATVVQPCNPAETRAALRWCVEEAPGVSVLRLVIGPSPRSIALPDGYVLTPGRGCLLQDGEGVLLVAYGPVMLHEALRAAETLAAAGERVAVANMPWLNQIDVAWWTELLARFAHVVVIEDHLVAGGLGERLLGTLSATGALERTRVHLVGLTDYPECGTPQEVLGAHQLDGASIAARVAALASLAPELHAVGSAVGTAGAYTAEAPQ